MRTKSDIYVSEDGNYLNSSSRHRLWQLPSRLHCCIIGTCLTVKELKKLSRKSNLDFHGMTDYDLHRAFVGVVGTASYPAKITQKHLDKKYFRFIQQFCDAREQSTLKKLWYSAVKKGDVAGPFWALVTHPSTSPELLEIAYGEVHMMSHLEGASTRVDIKKIAEYKNKLDSAQENEQTLIRRLNHREKEKNELRLALNDLADQLTNLKRDNLLLSQQIADMNATEGEENLLSEQIQRMNTEAEQATQLAEYWKDLSQREKERRLYLSEQLALKEEERQSMERTLYQTLKGACPDSCESIGTDNCALTDLAGQQVLYVGGRASQCAHFKRLVENLNGNFLHHDGGQSENQQKLISCLAQADAVLCPTDCVSHSAMHQVKKYCECHQKQIIWMPRASLSAFSRALEDVAA